MEELNEIQKKMKEKLSENKAEIQKYVDKIEEAEKLQKKAEADLLAAEAEVDVDKYNKAKNAIWSATHAKELYLKQKDKLKQEQLVSKSEYTQTLKEIAQLADKAHEEQNKRAAALIAELKNISEESNETSALANDLMHLLQRELYKESKGAIPNGNGTTWSSDKVYRNQDTVHSFYQSKIAGTSMAKRAGEKETQVPKHRYWG